MWLISRRMFNPWEDCKQLIVANRLTECVESQLQIEGALTCRTQSVQLRSYEARHRVDSFDPAAGRTRDTSAGAGGFFSTHAPRRNSCIQSNESTRRSLLTQPRGIRATKFILEVIGPEFSVFTSISATGADHRRSRPKSQTTLRATRRLG